MLEKPNQIAINEARQIVVDTAAKIADGLPENHYWGFSAYTMLLPYIFKEVGLSLQLPQSALSGPIWNYLDAACSAVVGIQQLTDKTNHRAVTNKIKGAINLLNGVQLTTLTAVNFSLLGGPGFALAFGIGFALSLDETIRAIRRFESFEYWLKDSLSQLEKTDTLIKTLEKEITELRNILNSMNRGSSKHPKMATWALEHKIERLNDLKNTKTSLERDVTVRLANKKYDEFSKIKMVGNTQLISQYIDETGIISDFTKKLKTLDSCTTEHELDAKLNSTNDLQIYSSAEFGKISKEVCREIEKGIQQENKIKIQAAVKDNFIWGMAFVGMLLLCIPTPATQTAGLIIVGIASALYVAKNVDRLAKGITYLATKLKGFFSESVIEEKAKNEGDIISPSVFKK